MRLAFSAVLRDVEANNRLLQVLDGVLDGLFKDGGGKP